jgi:type I restriction enzyme S subunit
MDEGASLLAGCDYLDAQMVARRWRQFRLQAGDVLLSTSASLGRVAVVGESEVGAIPYTGIIGFRPRSERILARFIPYALMAPSFKRQVEAMGVGSVMRHFGPMHLRQMTLDLPPVGQQEAIADVLGSLGDKMEANRQLAEQCDIAWRILLQTVVDGQVVPLADLADFVNGGAFTKGASGSGKMVVRIAELNSGPSRSTVYNDIEVKPERLANPGDLLFAWSGSLAGC